MSKEKMTVKEFVDKYNVLQSDKLKEDYVKSIVNSTYLPFENKVAICEKIIDSSHYIKTKGTDGVERKKMHVNSPANYMLYCLNIVDNYTNISIDFKNSLEEFNILNKDGLFDLISIYISEREKKEFRMILDMVENDLIQNEYEAHAFISNQVERFGNLASATLSPLLKQLIQGIDNMDEKTVDKLIDGLGKLNKFNVMK